MLGILGIVASALIALSPMVDDAIKEITLPLRHEDVIRQQARDKNLDPALIAAVIYRESKFRDATSKAGAKGLMQILPSTGGVHRAQAGGTAVRAGRPREPADQHLLRQLVPALPARPLRRQPGRGGRRVQRGPRACRRLGRQEPDAGRHPLPRDGRLHARRARQARRVPPRVSPRVGTPTARVGRTRSLPAHDARRAQRPVPVDKGLYPHDLPGAGW